MYLYFVKPLISSHKSYVKSKILSESKYELKNEKKRRCLKGTGKPVKV